METEKHLAYLTSFNARLIAFLIIIFFWIPTGAQHQESNEVIKQQRAIFIFNFAQQVMWPSLHEIDTFTIGVYAQDPTIINIEAISQQRTIYGKPVEVIKLNKLTDFKKANIIYINKEYGPDINTIIAAIQGTPILLITEAYPYNSSMINMVVKDGSYSYEINKDMITTAGLQSLSSLETYAISSIEKWRALYEDIEEQLAVIEEEKEVQEEIIKQQQEDLGSIQKEIELKETIINKKDSSIKTLVVDGELTSLKLEERIAFAKKLENNIAEQLQQITSYKEEIKSNQEKLAQQNEVLILQDNDITEKQKILDKKTIIISNQRKNNIALLSLLGLLLISSLLIYKAYAKNKKLNTQLESQNTSITQQAHLLKSKNKELEQFAYVASHDLQEPLSTVSSFIDLIKVDYGDKLDDDGRQSLDFIKEASTRMKQLIDGLLQYSRLGRGVDYTDVDCVQLLKEIKADLKVVIDESKARILYDDLPVIRGNEIELRLLFQNLISNSIKFRSVHTPPVIEIYCDHHTDSEHPSQEFWLFSITDNGIGIPSEHKDRIFGIFKRLHGRDTYEGSGIGLAHCKKIVESHKGRIWVESQVTQGSTFFVTIPKLTIA